jgi:hypothetical protein
MTEFWTRLKRISEVLIGGYFYKKVTSSLVMASAFARQVYSLPLPLFGTVGLFGLAARNYGRTVPLFLPWTFPVVVGGTWFLWYFLGDEVKQDMGLMRRPSPPPPSGGGGPPKLDAAASSAVLNAYSGSSSEEHELTDLQKKIKQEISKGDYSTLSEMWEKKMQKAVKPGDDDDDDDEEEEEEEEEEEGEEV